MATSTGSAPGVRTHFKTPVGRYNLSRDKVHPSAIPHYSLAAKVFSQVNLAHLKEKPTQSSSASSGISSTPGGVRFTARLLGAGNGSRSLGFGGNGFTGRLSASSKSPTVSNAGGAVGLSNGPLTSSYDGEGTYLIFNVGDAIFISDYYSQVKEPIKAIQFSNANPVCRHFDDDTKDSNDLLIGLSTGDVYSASLRQQLQDSGKKLVGAVHFNKDGSINSRWAECSHMRSSRLTCCQHTYNGLAMCLYSRCTAVSHVPNFEGIFVAAHADGNILVYDKTKDGSGDAPFPPVKDVAQFHVAHARSSKINGRDRKNEIRKFIDGSHSNIQEEMSVSVDREDDELTKYYDFLVIGSGIAGLRYALEVAKYGSVVILTKSEPHESNTVYAQGGVSAVLDPTDSVESHIRDTIVAGAFLCDEETVEVVCREGPERVKELIAWGALFDKSEDGQLHLAREGGHSHHRIVHAADMTGREIERALLTSVSQNPDIVIFKHHVAVDLLTLQDEENVVCYGVDALDIQSAKVVRFLAGVTMLASGGAGHVYPTTTNPLVATGDGVALAQRSRAVVSNMEFVQFHPTALADEGLPIKPAKRDNAFLITEAVRGAGGILYNQSMERFMPSYDSRAELAPRDVVARSIDDQLKKRDERFVYLDISHNSAKEIMAHFPNIAAECSKYGLDITKQPIPVVPAAHYMCGGVQTGLKGETSIKGLFAAGEVTCTGLHGANRLASNSLLEALVFAERAVEPSVAYALQSNVGRAEVKQAKKWPRPLAPSAAKHLKMDEILRITSLKRKRLQQVMWDYVGIVRSTERLKRAQAELRELECEWEAQLLRNGWTPIMVNLEVCEMRNLISVAYLIVNSALTRQESRGLHFTTSFPQLVESERFPTILFPTNPVTNSWSSQVVHRLAIESQ